MMAENKKKLYTIGEASVLTRSYLNYLYIRIRLPDTEI